MSHVHESSCHIVPVCRGLRSIAIQTHSPHLAGNPEDTWSLPRWQEKEKAALWGRMAWKRLTEVGASFFKLLTSILLWFCGLRWPSHPAYPPWKITEHRISLIFLQTDRKEYKQGRESKAMCGLGSLISANPKQTLSLPHIASLQASFFCPFLLLITPRILKTLLAPVARTRAWPLLIIVTLGDLSPGQGSGKAGEWAVCTHGVLTQGKLQTWTLASWVTNVCLHSLFQRVLLPASGRPPKKKGLLCTFSTSWCWGGGVWRGPSRKGCQPWQKTTQRDWGLLCKPKHLNHFWEEERADVIRVVSECRGGSLGKNHREAKL